MGILISLIQMASLPLMTWLRLLIWMAIGLGVYFVYGIKHSTQHANVDAAVTDDAPLGQETNA